MAASRAKRPRLFAGNLSEKVTEDIVASLFAKYGRVESVWLRRDRNFAFVEYQVRAAKRTNQE